MRSVHTIGLPSAIALLGVLAVQAFAQTTATPPIAPHMPGRMGKSGMSSHMGKPMLGHGGIIGNKNTKVYHLPGDKGPMPAEKNRVYFRTERQAMAAGYHVAGVHKAPRPIMMHSNATTRMAPGKSGTTGHLPK